MSSVSSMRAGYAIAEQHAVMPLRRVRGFLLRLARQRSAAIVVGAALAAPALWIEIGGRGNAWWIQGLALVLGATGAALLWTGVMGSRPDWIDGK